LQRKSKNAVKYWGAHDLENPLSNSGVYGHRMLPCLKSTNYRT